MPTGKFFVLDGVDGSGKSTTVDLLRDKLWEKYGGERTVITRVPGGTGLGAELRRIVKSQKFNISSLAERLIFAADEHQTVDEIIKPALEAGKVIVSSRGFFTDYAYGLARGLPESEIEAIHNVNALPKADCMFIFSLPFKTILERKKYRLSTPCSKHDRFETKPGSNCSNVMIDEDYLRKVHGFYELALSTYTVPAAVLAHKYAHKVTRVDATQEPKAVAAELFETIVETYEK